MAEPGLLFRQLASSFPAMAALFCLMHYAVYGLAVWAGRLYFARTRRFFVHDQYESDPRLRHLAERGCRLTPGLAAALLAYVGLAAVLHALPALATWRQQDGQASLLPSALRAFAEISIALLIARYTLLAGLYLRDILASYWLMCPEHVSGRIRATPLFDSTHTRLTFMACAGVLAALAVCQPSTVTIGFLLGALVLAEEAWRVEMRQERTKARVSVDDYVI